MGNRATESAMEAGRLCETVKGLPQDKAVLAAMMADAFINGMNMQESLAASGTPQRAQA